MTRNKVFVAVGLLVLAGFLGTYGYLRSGTPQQIPILPELVDNSLPDSPNEWHGRVDYNRLHRELTALSLRPEMAGLAVAVVEDGELRFVHGYGTVDKSTGVAVTPQTLFRWASVSKTATGMLAAKLASEGTLDLGRPLASWQTSLRLPGGAEERLTLEQLLSHQTGITKNAYDEKLEAGEEPQSIRAKLSAAPIQCEPGTCYTYQNIAFDTSSEILAAAAQKPFPDAVSERLFVPLGMASARYGMAGLIEAKDWARPHSRSGVSRVKEAYWRVPAAAGVESDIVDFAKWMQAAMGDRPDILPASTLQIAETPRVATPRIFSGKLAKSLSDTGYGLGMRSFTYAGHRLIGIRVAVAGYRAMMLFDPKTRIGVVAMWNANWGIPFRVPFAVLDSYYGLPDCGWLDVSEIPLPDAAPLPQAEQDKKEEETCPTR